MMSNVSPGRMNPTSSPVSLKTMRQTTSSAHGPAATMIACGSSQGMSPLARAGRVCITGRAYRVETVSTLGLAPELAHESLVGVPTTGGPVDRTFYYRMSG